MQYTDLNDLPEQFTDRTAGFNRMQQQWYAALLQGAKVVPELVKESASYRAVIEVFQKQTGAGTGETYWQMQLRHKRERNQCLQQNGIDPERIGKAEVAEYIGKGLDDIEAGKRPNVTGYARERGSSDRHIRAVQQRDTTRSNEAAFEQHKEHPVMRLIADHSNVTDMHKGTVTRSLRKVGEQYTLAQRVAALEAQMKAQADMLERRFSIIEAGEHWHDVARRLLAEGATQNRIARITGQKVDTVKKFIRRERAADVTTPTE